MAFIRAQEMVFIRRRKYRSTLEEFTGKAVLVVHIVRNVDLHFRGGDALGSSHCFKICSLVRFCVALGAREGWKETAG